MKRILVSFMAVCAVCMTSAQSPSIQSITFPYKSDDSISMHLSGQAYTATPFFCDVWITDLGSNQLVFNPTGVFIGASPGYYATLFSVGGLKPGTSYRVQVSVWDSTGSCPYMEYVSTTGTAPVTGIAEVMEESPNETVDVYETVTGRLLGSCRKTSVLSFLQETGFVGVYTIFPKNSRAKTFGIVRP